MWGRRILFIAAIAAAVWYLKQHSAANVKPFAKATGGDKPSAAYGCVAAADRANDALRSAASMMKPPVDAGAWANEEGKVSSTIETAESECGGASSDVDRH